MNKIIDFLFSCYTNTQIYVFKLHKKDFKESYVYAFMFIFLFGIVAVTSLACFFQIKWDISFNKVPTTCIVLFISALIATTFVYKAKNDKFVENKLATIEPKSDKEMKEYISHATFTKFLPFCFYVYFIKFICRIINSIFFT